MSNFTYTLINHQEYLNPRLQLTLDKITTHMSELYHIIKTTMNILLEMFGGYIDYQEQL